MDKKPRSFLSEIPVHDLAKLQGVIAFQLSYLAAYEFYNVPPSEYVGLTNTSSHGRYFHAHIKNRYASRKIAG